MFTLLNFVFLSVWERSCLNSYYAASLIRLHLSDQLQSARTLDAAESGIVLVAGQEYYIIVASVKSAIEGVLCPSRAPKRFNSLWLIDRTHGGSDSQRYVTIFVLLLRKK